MMNMSDHSRRTFFPHHKDNNKSGTSKKNYNSIFILKQYIRIVAVCCNRAVTWFTNSHFVHKYSKSVT